MKRPSRRRLLLRRQPRRSPGARAGAAAGGAGLSDHAADAGAGEAHRLPGRRRVRRRDHHVESGAFGDVGLHPGLALAGVRVFTATASQGPAADARAAALRAERARADRDGQHQPHGGLALGLLADQTDSLAQRDTGWIQFYVESPQEALDTVLKAFRVAEASLLPVLVNLDAFYVSHSLEPVARCRRRAAVDAYLDYAPPHRLDRRSPNPGATSSRGTCSSATAGTSRRRWQAMPTGARTDRAWARARRPQPRGVLERYRCDDARLVLVTMGSMAGSARDRRCAARRRRRWACQSCACSAPLPVRALRAALAGVPVLVLDRNHSPGAGGVLHQELRAALYGMDGRAARAGRPGRRGRRQRARGGSSAWCAGAGAPSHNNPAGWGEHTDHRRWDRDATCAPSCCAPGHALPGLRRLIALRHMLAVLTDTVAVVPPSCMAIIAGPQPFARCASRSTSRRWKPAPPRPRACAARSMRGKRDTQVMVLAGDGGTLTSGCGASVRPPGATRTSSTFCLDNGAT